MSNQTIDRRKMLMGTGLVAAGAVAGSLAAASPAQAGTDRGGPAIGAWMTDREDPFDFTANGIWTFVAGGVVHYQDLYGVAGGVPRATLAPPLMGAWVSVSGPEVRYTMWSPSPELVPGLPPLIARTSGTATVSDDAIESTYLVEFSTPGQDPVFTFEGRIRGTRIAP